MHVDERAGVFWRWWTAGTTSMVGSAVGAVALPLTALTVLDASAFQLGLIAAASYVAWIVIGLPAGVIVQRLPLRGAQVGADLARAVAVASIPLAWWWGHLTVAHLVVTALVVSFANVLFDVANSTFLPSIVEREQLQSRNSLTSATHAATLLSGPSLGGLAVQTLGAVPTLLVDSASYLVSAALLRTLPATRVDTPDQWPPIGELIRAGWRYVAHHPVIGPSMWAATTMNLVCGAQFALHPLYLVRELHAPVGLVGVLLAVEGVGALVGAALTTRITTRIGTARALIAAEFTTVVGAFLIPWGTGWLAYAAFAAGSVVFSLGTVVLSVTTRTYRQIASPPDLLSRVMATVRFVSWGAIPVGGLVAGALAGPLGARATLFVFAATLVCAPLVLLLSPVRRLRDLTDHDQGDEPSRPATSTVGVGDR
ncbi:MFS transporter [Micromonospora zamorensis]|uniref:MFS transporter n=1 Tax=Micromonospora zamorensis TaxID=709883 RepID=UPI002ED0F985|nr:MFS transporter [Micromonospora zamorensis]